MSVVAAPAPEVAEFVDNFEGVDSQFRILDKVGEGTFSMVFRAIDLHSPGQNEVVAVKRIHATSSPARIRNELEILAALHDGEYICSVITAMRCRDQVLLVMPYIEFTDFRFMYNTSELPEMQVYMSQLLKALEFTAERGVIHRDVKPTNFLYNRDTQKGLLVDFGLAEFENPHGDCVCMEMESMPRPGIQPPPEGGYRRDDSRPARRANRAGTRGFRAPEVLLKCNRQSAKIDVWAAGVVLLMMLTKKFPFFQSLDDADALVEIASIYGRRDMRAVAGLHGAVFETNLPTISEHRHSWVSIVDWCNDRPVDKRRHQFPLQEPENEHRALELVAIDLLSLLMELDVHKRPTASEALTHPFLNPASH